MELERLYRRMKRAMDRLFYDIEKEFMDSIRELEDSMRVTKYDDTIRYDFYVDGIPNKGIVVDVYGNKLRVSAKDGYEERIERKDGYEYRKEFRKIEYFTTVPSDWSDVRVKRVGDRLYVDLRRKRYGRKESP